MGIITNNNKRGIKSYDLAYSDNMFEGKHFQMFCTTNTFYELLMRKEIYLEFCVDWFEFDISEVSSSCFHLLPVLRDQDAGDDDNWKNWIHRFLLFFTLWGKAGGPLEYTLREDLKYKMQFWRQPPNDEYVGSANLFVSIYVCVCS